MALLCVSCEPTSRGLEPDFSATHRAPHGPENPENRADDDQKPTDVGQRVNWQNVTEDAQDNSEHDHDDTISVVGELVSQLPVSVPITSAAYRAADGAENPQNRTDHQQDD